MKGTQEPSFQPAPLPPLARVIFGLRPRSASVLAAAVLIAGALAFALAEQTPVGRVQGEVVRIGERTPIAGAQIILTPAETEGVAKRLLLYAQTRENGRFSLAHVPAGLYQVSAYLDTYTVAYADLTVDEGRTATVRLELNTARPQLQVVGPQRLFATAERVILPVRGYVDSTAPAPQRAIHVRIYRTRLSAVLKDPLAARALDRIGNDWEPPMALPDALLKPRSGAAPQLLWERDLRIVEAGAEGFYTKRIEVGRPGVGLYLVEARYARTTISTWMLVTDTALVLKRSPGELLAYVADVQTGVPAPGSVVSLHRQGQALGRRRTGADGIARFTLPETEGEFHLVAVARRGNDEAVVAGTDYRFEDGGEFVLFAYTERPIYRPGQRIYYKGLARRKTAREIEYLVPASQAVTVEVRDPGGDLVFREQRKTNAFGSFHGQFDLSPEAPTGTYGMSLSAGATTSTHDIVIASYRKPEFTVTVAPEKPRYTTGDTVKMNVSAQFFFGAPVAGGSVSYLVYRSPDWASAYLAREGVEPDDEADSSISYSGDGRTVAEGKVQLDESGKAVLTFSADVPTEPDSPQDQIFTVQATVTDASGREASAEEIVEVVAGGFRLVAITDGHVVAPGKPTRVRLVARDYEGHPVPNQKVTLEANYLVWNSKNREYASLSAGGQATVTGPDGTATVAVTLPRGGYVRLVARATDSKGREIRASDFVWAAEGTTSDLGMKYARLSLLSDRRRYRQGETARVLINTDRVGQTVLLTVEGAKVYRAITVPITQRSTVVSVPILGAYGRNVFLSALYVKDKRLATSDLTLSVAIPQTEVKVSIRSDRSRYGPGEKVTYAVETTDAQGRPLPAEFSLGVVDESIYALQEDDPKALRNAFYPRRWNMVRTSFSNELRYLGDADKAAAQINIRRRFVDTAFWAPALRTDAQGRATVAVELPDNLTTWRATAVAHTTKTRVGRATHTVIASKDFFVRVETPRLFTQRDRSRILVLVHNETDSPQQTTIRLQVDGLKIEGQDTLTLVVAPRKVERIEVPVTAGPTGPARIRVTAQTSGSDRRQYTDGVELSVPVQPHGRVELAGVAGDVTAERPSTETLRLDPAAIPDATRLSVRITPSITSSIVGALDYLLGFPYGCVEQTMSRFLPTVLVQQALRAHGASDPARAAAIRQMVRDGVTRLYRFQHESGGWGWWEFDDDDPWMTAYVLYGLTSARTAGFEVRDSVVKNAATAALEMAKTARPNTRMFLLYAVALAGDGDGARAARTSVPLKDLGPEGVAYRVLLDRLLGVDHRPAFAELGRRAISQSGTTHWRSAETGRQWDWEWDDSMATALGLRAILAVNRQDPRIGSILRWMMWNRTGDYWRSTRDTSWALAALADYLKVEDGTAALAGEVRVRLNGQVVQTYRLTPALASSPDLLLTLPGSALRAGPNEVTLERTGGTGRTFYSIQLRQTVGMEDIPPLSSRDVRIQREYLRILPKKVGSDTWSLQTEPSFNRFGQGDRVMVRLTITAARDLAYVMLEDPFPAGFEVTERGSAEIDEWTYWWASTDVRDDRIAFFVRSLPAGTHVIEYNLRAQTPGLYYGLPATIQGMYSPQVRAESSGARVTIK